jgi:NAD(P)-dependent dehydrogenase (short-subunit alcohol dehydrogenase family)
MERRVVTGHKPGSGQLAGFNDTRITCSFNYMVPAPRITGSLAQGGAGSRCRLGDTSAPGQAFAEFSGGILAGRAGTPEDVTGTALYLASEDSDYMTGQVVMIDGGMVLV